MNKRVLIDQNTLQVKAHLDSGLIDPDGKFQTNPDGTHFRLKSFLAVLDQYGTYDFTDELIKPGLLSQYDLYVVLNRVKPYENSELENIVSYVQEGGRLLVMSNHAPLEEIDNSLSSKFGIKLSGAYWSGNSKIHTSLSSKELTSHKVISGVDSKHKTGIGILEIVTNSTCKINIKYGDIISYLSDSMVEGEERIDSPEKKIFGVSIDSSHIQGMNGKIIVLADSSFIAEEKSSFPDWGIFDQGDNPLFIQRIFEFLLS